MAHSFRRQFDAVDKTADPSDFVQYLDAVRATDFFQEIKKRTLALMDLRPGDAALDVGCGTGEDVLALAAGVAPGGHAVGVDLSATMIATARQRSGKLHSAARFVRADAHNLPFRDAYFDAVRTERLLQHSPRPQIALGEMIRVLKPGGRLVIWEADLDLFVIDAPDYEASRLMQRFICDRFHSGSIGHRLYGMFLERGLVQVGSIPLVRNVTDLKLLESAFDLTASVKLAAAQGILESQRGRHWLDSLQAASAAGRFLSTVGGFITAGVKP